LEASKPGRRKATAGENVELLRLRGEVDRLSTAIVEQAIELAALRGKSAWG
jgi:membrane-bound ClpP family serine protease